LSGRGLCDGLITRPEESYRLWRVVVCDQETSKTRRLKPAAGLRKIQPQCVVMPGKQQQQQTEATEYVLLRLGYACCTYVAGRRKVKCSLQQFCYNYHICYHR
jgi:hypothetical protein